MLFQMAGHPELPFLGHKSLRFQNSNLRRWVREPRVVGQTFSDRPGPEPEVSVGERPARSPCGCPRTLAGVTGPHVVGHRGGTDRSHADSVLGRQQDVGEDG